jgi:hypothetical protein
MVNNASRAAVAAPIYIPSPNNKFPLKPITMASVAARTVPIIEATTLTPHSRVVLSPPLFFIEEEEEAAMLIRDGNWKPIRRPAGNRRATVSAIL